MKPSFLLPLLLLLPLQSLLGQSQILIDGDLSDWQSLAPVHIDLSGDDGSSQIDFGQLWAHDDTRFLYLSLEVGKEINLQDGNEIVLYLDTDHSAGTGFSVQGIGAELSYAFGNRQGMVYAGGNSQMVYHDDIRLISAPTVSSTQFELVISKEVAFWGQELFQGDSIRIVVKDDAGNGDQLPDAQGGVAYSLSNQPHVPLPPYSLARPDSSNLRVLSYNVLSDGLFESDRAAPMYRLIAAIAPDILGFQEIYNHSSQQVANAIESILPSGPGEQWYHAQEGPDIIAVSRFPIIDSYPILNNGAFLLDLQAVFGRDLLLIVAHPPCCANDFGRQVEIDAIMGFIRDAKAGNGAVQLAEDSPILIVGDMNLVGDHAQLHTLLNGDIFDETAYGADFQPDWDSTALEDARPIVPGLPMNYTWFSENSSFSPGRLDYIVYSGSVLELRNAVSLFSRTLPQDSLTAYGLQQEDAIVASDHLPIVGDFRLAEAEPPTYITLHLPDGLFLLQNQPNPFRHQTRISYQLLERAFVRLSIFNEVGAEMTTVVQEDQAAGEHSLVFQARGWKPGIYFLRLELGQRVLSGKMLLIK